MSKRFSIECRDRTEYSLWLALTRAGDVRMSRGEPSLSRDERALQLVLAIPAAVFSTPQLRATITIDEPDAAGCRLDIREAAETLKLAMGVDIDLRIIPQPESAHAQTKDDVQGSHGASA